MTFVLCTLLVGIFARPIGSLGPRVIFEKLDVAVPFYRR